MPEANASWFPEYIRQYHNVDCSVAVQVRTGMSSTTTVWLQACVHEQHLDGVVPHGALPPPPPPPPPPSTCHRLPWG